MPAHDFTIDRGEGPVALAYGPFRDGEGTLRLAQYLDQATDAELAAIGVTRGVAAPVVPVEVPRLYARLALQGAGYLETVEAAVAAADPATQIAYQDAASFRRADPTLLAVAAGVGWTSEDLDNLFLAAAALQAEAGG